MNRSWPILVLDQVNRTWAIKPTFNFRPTCHEPSHHIIEPYRLYYNHAKNYDFKLLKYPLEQTKWPWTFSWMTIFRCKKTLGTVQLTMDIVTIISSHIDWKTISIMMIFELVEHPWDSPTCHGHCYQNIEP